MVKINSWKKFLGFGIIIVLLAVGVLYIKDLSRALPRNIASKVRDLLKDKKSLSRDNNPQAKESPKPDAGTLDWQIATEHANWSVRDSHAAFVFKDRIWLMGGLEGKRGRSYEEDPHKSDIWVSDDGANWHQVSNNAPWGKRRSAQVVIFRDKVWLIAGWEQESGKTKNDVWSSEDGVNWNLAIPFAPWIPREGHSVVVFQDKLWVMGGVNYFNNKQLMNDVWYSEDGINWIMAAEHAGWAPRYDQSAAVFKNKIWLTAGRGFNEPIKRDIWISENGKDWQMVSDNPDWPARHGHVSLVFNDALWLISGYNESGGISDVWYSEDGVNWQKTKKDPSWMGREDHTAVVFRDKIWLMAGMMDGEVWTNDVWFSKFSPGG